MEFKPYPKWKYHAKKGAVVVKNEDEENDLGRGWQDTPFEQDVVEVQHPAAVELTAFKASHEALVDELNALVNGSDAAPATLRALVDQLAEMKAANTQVVE